MNLRTVVKALKRWSVAALLFASTLNPRPSTAQTSLLWTNLQMTGSTNDEQVTFTPDNNPIWWNGTLYSMPATGTNVTTTNGIGQVYLVPNGYTMVWAGLPLSYHFYVTNSTQPLSIASLLPNIPGQTIYSGIQTLQGAGGITIYGPNGPTVIISNNASGGNGGGFSAIVNTNDIKHTASGSTLFLATNYDIGGIAMLVFQSISNLTATYTQAGSNYTYNASNNLATLNLAWLSASNTVYFNQFQNLSNYAYTASNNLATLNLAWLSASNTVYFNQFQNLSNYTYNGSNSLATLNLAWLSASNTVYFNQFQNLSNYAYTASNNLATLNLAWLNASNTVYFNQFQNLSNYTYNASNSLATLNLAWLSASNTAYYAQFQNLSNYTYNASNSLTVLNLAWLAASNTVYFNQFQNLSNYTFNASNSLVAWANGVFAPTNGGMIFNSKLLQTSNLMFGGTSNFWQSSGLVRFLTGPNGATNSVFIQASSILFTNNQNQWYDTNTGSAWVLKDSAGNSQDQLNGSSPYGNYSDAGAGQTASADPGVNFNVNGIQFIGRITSTDLTAQITALVQAGQGISWTTASNLSLAIANSSSNNLATLNLAWLAASNTVYFTQFQNLSNYTYNASNSLATLNLAWLSASNTAYYAQFQNLSNYTYNASNSIITLTLSWLGASNTSYYAQFQNISNYVYNTSNLLSALKVSVQNGGANNLTATNLSLFDAAGAGLWVSNIVSSSAGHRGSWQLYIPPLGTLLEEPTNGTGLQGVGALTNSSGSLMAFNVDLTNLANAINTGQSNNATIVSNGVMAQVNAKMSTNGGTSWNQVELGATIGNSTITNSPQITANVGSNGILQFSTNLAAGPNVIVYILTNYLKVSSTNAGTAFLNAGAFEYRSNLNIFTNIQIGAWVTNVPAGFNLNTNGGSSPNGQTFYNITGSSVTGVYNGANGGPGTVTVTYGELIDCGGIFFSNLPAAQLVGTLTNNTTGAASSATNAQTATLATNSILATNVVAGAAFTNISFSSNLVWSSGQVILQRANTNFYFPSITNSYAFGWQPFDTLILPAGTNQVQGAASGLMFCPSNFTVQGVNKYSSVLLYDTNLFQITNGDVFEDFSAISTNLWASGGAALGYFAFCASNNAVGCFWEKVSVSTHACGVGVAGTGAIEWTVANSILSSDNRAEVTTGATGWISNRNDIFTEYEDTNQGSITVCALSLSTASNYALSNFVDNCTFTLDCNHATNGVEYIILFGNDSYWHVANINYRIIDDENVPYSSLRSVFHWETAAGGDFDSSLPLKDVNFNFVGNLNGFPTWPKNDPQRLGNDELCLIPAAGISIVSNAFFQVPNTNSFIMFDSTTNPLTTTVWSSLFGGLLPNYGNYFDFSGLVQGFTNNVNITNANGCSVTLFATNPANQLWVTNLVGGPRIILATNGDAIGVSNVGSMPLTAFWGSFQTLNTFASPTFSDGAVVTEEMPTGTNSNTRKWGWWQAVGSSGLVNTNITRVYASKTGPGTHPVGLTNFWCANAAPLQRQKVFNISFTGLTNQPTTNQLPYSGAFCDWLSNFPASVTNRYQAVNSNGVIVNNRILFGP